jgi:lia operon protein LiaG
VFGRHIQVSIDFQVRIPERSDANLETANGNVRAEGVQGRLRLGSTNGNVEAADVQGDVDASTTNGNAEVRCGNLKADDRISCRTTNGDATAVVTDKTEAEVELSTVNGQVHCDLPVTVQGGISDRRIRGRIGQGGGSVHLSTVNGNVRLGKE